MRQPVQTPLLLAAALALAGCGLGGILNTANSDKRTATDAPAKPTITYDFTGDSRAEVDAKASAYCYDQGRSAYIRGVVTDNGGVHHATYDCR
jgi:predicted small lipoprotein YifL